METMIQRTEHSRLQPDQYTPVCCIDNQNRKQSYSVCSPHVFIAHVSLYFFLQSVIIKHVLAVHVNTCQKDRYSLNSLD